MCCWPFLRGETDGQRSEAEHEAVANGSPSHTNVAEHRPLFGSETVRVPSARIATYNSGGAEL
jgi:hypothetical protein